MAAEVEKRYEINAVSTAFTLVYVLDDGRSCGSTVVVLSSVGGSVGGSIKILYSVSLYTHCYVIFIYNPNVDISTANT